ncbi:MAG TPA: GNAT family N-acetyltransferase [Gaiellaceae bacterium]|nr:GNAT family N-acetyltransferase [Gaiellaceae bacterium]
MASGGPAIGENEFVVREASGAELPALTETISLAFHDDPTWSWAFPDAALRGEHFGVFWSFMIAGALRYPWVLCTDHYEAVAIWIPPGGTELAEEDEARMAPLLESLVGPHSHDVLELIARFDGAHPHDEPHFYLSLLGTHPAHRGQGIGMWLLAENLERIDAERMPAYLESSNPANNHRYEHLGFAAVGEFFPPGERTPITTMWRDSR